MVNVNVGDKVLVSFTGTVKSTKGDKWGYIKEGEGLDDIGSSGFVAVNDANYITHVVWVGGSGMRGSEPLTVTRPVEPDNWPPRVGDIWRASGSEFSVRADYSGSGIVLTNLDGAYPTEFRTMDLDGFKVLNPKLVRRRVS